MYEYVNDVKLIAAQFGIALSTLANWQKNQERNSYAATVDSAMSGMTILRSLYEPVLGLKAEAAAEELGYSADFYTVVDSQKYYRWRSDQKKIASLNGMCIGHNFNLLCELSKLAGKDSVLHFVDWLQSINLTTKDVTQLAMVNRNALGILIKLLKQQSTTQVYGGGGGMSTLAPTINYSTTLKY